LYVEVVGLPKVLLKLEDVDAFDGARGLRYGDG
jgi:hypothetical protein